MKLRYVIPIVLVFISYLFRRELRAMYGYTLIYKSLCYPEVYPDTCPGLAGLAQMQYSRWEAAFIALTHKLTDPHRAIDYAPIGIVLFIGAYAIRKCRRKGVLATTTEIGDIDLLDWLDE